MIPANTGPSLLAQRDIFLVQAFLPCHFDPEPFASLRRCACQTKHAWEFLAVITFIYIATQHHEQSFIKSRSLKRNLSRFALRKLKLAKRWPCARGQVNQPRRAWPRCRRRCVPRWGRATLRHLCVGLRD